MKCRKTAWSSRAAAEKFLAELWEDKAAHTRAKLPAYAYECDGHDGQRPCWQWHVTSTPTYDQPRPSRSRRNTIEPSQRRRKGRSKK